MLTSAASSLGGVIDAMSNVLITTLPLFLGIAVLVFFWGLVKFITHAGDEKMLDEGKQLMIWGMISIFVMVALWSIIAYFQSELGLDTGISLGTMSEPPYTIPTP